jgi:hypothetical protein
MHRSCIVRARTPRLLPMVMQPLSVPPLNSQRTHELSCLKPRGENDNVRGVGLRCGAHSVGEDLDDVVLHELEIWGVERVEVQLVAIKYSPLHELARLEHLFVRHRPRTLHAISHFGINIF